MSSSFEKHMTTGAGMTLRDFANGYHWIYSHFETDVERLKALPNGFTLLFYHTKECEEFNSHPFSRPLDEILDDYVRAKVISLF